MTSLVLGGNGSFTNRCAKDLAEHLPESCLTSLTFFEPWNLTAEGVKALSDVLRASSLTELDLDRNDLKDEDLASLLEGLPDSGIAKISLGWGWHYSKKFGKKIAAIVKENKERSVVLQMQWLRTIAGLTLTFHSIHGDVKAVLEWREGQRVQDLAEAVLKHMRSQGFQLPFRPLRGLPYEDRPALCHCLGCGPRWALWASSLAFEGASLCCSAKTPDNDTLELRRSPGLRLSNGGI